MVLATVYETIAFLIPDRIFYTYGIFGCGSPLSAVTGFYTALPDIFTLVDLLYIPLAFASLGVLRLPLDDSAFSRNDARAVTRSVLDTHMGSAVLASEGGPSEDYGTPRSP